MKKLKTQAVKVSVPQNDIEAREAIRQIGDLNREALRLQTELNDAIAALQEHYGNKVSPINARVQATHEGLKVFCEANRDRLTNGGKIKSYQFSTGEVSWRVRPPKVFIRGKDAVITAIKAARLGKKFLRVKEDVNKEAMLDDKATAQAIKGVTIGSGGEDFIVEPYETEIIESA